jgi:beta-glucanase (GH16 family)
MRIKRVLMTSLIVAPVIALGIALPSVGAATTQNQAKACTHHPHDRWRRCLQHPYAREKYCVNHPDHHKRMCSAILRALVKTASPTTTLAPSPTTTLAGTTGMAPPPGYSPSQRIFDDQFTGRSLDSARWNTEMGGQGDSVWNSAGLPSGDSAAGTHLHQTYFSPSQVTVDDGLNLTMVPDAKYSSLGYGYRSGVVTSRGKFTLTGGYVQIKAKLPDTSEGSWPAIWFIDPNSGSGSQEIDLQEGGFTPADAGLPSSTQENDIFVSTYHTQSGSQSDFGYATPAPMNTGYNTYGMEYIPGRSIKTYFNGTLVGWWTQNVGTNPYEIVMWNSQAASNTSGYHTTGASPNPSVLSVAEVQAYALAP